MRENKNNNNEKYLCYNLNILTLLKIIKYKKRYKIE